jgi:hypothetical protein
MKTEPLKPSESPGKAALYRKLPSVDELLREPTVGSLAEQQGRAVVTDAAREALDSLRGNIASGTLSSEEIEARIAKLPRSVELNLERSLASSLRPVINATGVILHTNLGRAPLSEAALVAIQEWMVSRNAEGVGGGYSNSRECRSDVKIGFHRGDLSPM